MTKPLPFEVTIPRNSTDDMESLQNDPNIGALGLAAELIGAKFGTVTIDKAKPDQWVVRFGKYHAASDKNTGIIIRLCERIANKYKTTLGIDTPQYHFTIKPE